MGDPLLPYSSAYLFNTLDADQNGTIELAELEDYLSTYGMVANLNIISAPATAKQKV